MKKTSRLNIERSAIMLLTVLLCIALPNLLLRAHNTSIAISQDDYPELYAPYNEPIPVSAEHKAVYLTFDDGPSPNTEHILEILRERGAKATFFVTAQYWKEEYLAHMYEQIIEEGHTLGLHSYSHEFSEIYAEPDAYLKDIDRLRELIEKSCGYRPSIMRFPGGSKTANASKHTMGTLISEMESRGYKWYDWDISVGDDETNLRSPEDIAKSIIDGVRGRRGASVILCHDNETPKTTPDGIRIAIDELYNQGYEFYALSPTRYLISAE